MSMDSLSAFSAPELSGSAAASLTALGSGAPSMPSKNASPAAMQKSAQDFEAFFASQVLNEMFADVKSDDIFGGGHGEEMFRPFLLDEYAKGIAKRGGFGIAQAVMGTLLRQQEVPG